jgi:predicted ferric reductase
MLGEVNPAAGLIAGCLIVGMAFMANRPIRRRFYWAFLLVHSLWPLVYLMAFLHTLWSRTTAIYPFIVGLTLLVIDFAIQAADHTCRPLVILDAGTITERTLSSDHRADATCPPHTAYIVLEKITLFSAWKFGYNPGQHVYITVPSISPFSHPYSISSVARLV